MAQEFSLEKARETALKYGESLRNNISIEGMYLFGSYAKNEQKEDSDIDIAVISEDFKGDNIDDIAFLMKFRRNISRRIEPHPFLMRDFNENNPLANEIINTGVRII
ncbi:MAG: nucleotidyltransferase domain-containing protein [Endomicrobium sp.]|jgi:predicted nucleotidyltransferase|nr:nucleotidyltransferase domain-containing protein [Endomicrobium sp.]